MSTVQTENIYSDIEQLFSDVLGTPVRFAEVGGRIKEIRGDRSQEEFARLLEVEQQRYISSFEHGFYLTKNADMLRKVAALDPQERGIVWLMGGDEALKLAAIKSESATSDKKKTDRERLKIALRAAQQVTRELEQLTGGGKDED